MDSARPPTLRGLITRMLCTLLALLLVLYPLSIGPAYYYIDAHYLPHTVKDYSIINKVYEPLFFVVRIITPLSPPLHAYLHFWMRLGRKRSGQPPP